MNIEYSGYFLSRVERQSSIYYIKIVLRGFHARIVFKLLKIKPTCFYSTKSNKLL